MKLLEHAGHVVMYMEQKCRTKGLWNEIFLATDNFWTVLKLRIFDTAGEIEK